MAEAAEKVHDATHELTFTYRGLSPPNYKAIAGVAYSKRHIRKIFLSR